MRLYYGDNKVIIKSKLEKYCFDSIVTDPPYGLKFMNAVWDYSVPSIKTWRIMLEYAKPGCYLLCFGGTRTFHRIAVAIEDAGWEIKDCIMWTYGSGFPKSLDISKAIDKSKGLKRRVLSIEKRSDKTSGNFHGNSESRTPIDYAITEAESREAKQWEGWGTALKPAWEPIIIARKPLIGTVAENVLKYGTGGMNIDGCRVEYTENNRPIPQLAQGKTEINTTNGMYGGNSYNESKTKSTIGGSLKGRFPANLIHDGSEEVLGLFPITNSGLMRRGTQRLMSSNPNKNVYGRWKPDTTLNDTFGDSGSAARFFYTAKASRSEREERCTGEIKGVHRYGKGIGGGKDPNAPAMNRNTHPTVKPVSLMRYLVRLVTPPHGTVLDPFMGSGTTGVACKKEGFEFIGIDNDRESFDIAKERINLVKEQRLKRRNPVDEIVEDLYLKRRKLVLKGLI